MVRLLGQTLPHFKITAKLGESGMEEVSRTEDTKFGYRLDGGAVKCLSRTLLRNWLSRAATFVVIATSLGACVSEEPDERRLDVEHSEHGLEYLDVTQLQEFMQSGELTSAELITYFLDRISNIDSSGPKLRSILEINPDAMSIAIALDKERTSDGPRGPLHGIPVVLKGNIDTGDSMATTAGSLALAGHRAPDDAFHVEALRAAGTVILGKANLSEWSYFRSTEASSGWSSVGGQVRNPYVLDRNPCGSSSGPAVAVAAGLTPLAVGTETVGSIVCPSSVNGIVGIKPTVGLVSRVGIIPISHTQDTAGPMARSVRDAAILLTAMAVRDDGDPAAKDHPGHRDYSASLDAGALAGARIGVWRAYFGASVEPRVTPMLERVVGELEAAGATVVDPVELAIPEGAYGAMVEVLRYEFKVDLEHYLQTAGVDPSVDTLAELIEFNRSHADEVMQWFGQEAFEAAVEKGPLTDSAYREALETSWMGMRRALDTALNGAELDAIVAPTSGPGWPIDWVSGDRITLSSALPAGAAGYPSITLPMGAIHNLPVGMSFIGRAWSEPKLIGYAYALESRLEAWSPPRFLPSIEVERSELSGSVTPSG
jgi:amidase